VTSSREHFHLEARTRQDSGLRVGEGRTCGHCSHPGDGHQLKLSRGDCPITKKAPLQICNQVLSDGFPECARASWQHRLPERCA
jgi:hypothetical protein